jgi:hypothetical protein
MRRFSNIIPTSPSTSSAKLSRNLCLTYSAFSQVRLLTTSERDELSRVISSVQSEAKGQSVDLSEMADATRNALKQIQDATKKVNITEPRAKAKIQTLQTALKAYSGRINNIQNEAKSLQADAEKVLKLLFDGKDAETEPKTEKSTSTSSSTKSNTVVQEEEDFNVEPPMTAQKLEEMNKMPPGSTTFKKADGSSSSSTAETSNTVAEEEIVIELEEDPSAAANNNNNNASGAETDHEKGIDFTDCREAKTLRQRYKDFLDGKFQTTKQAPPRVNTQQPPSPSSSSSSNASSSYGSGYSQQYNQQSYAGPAGGAGQPHPSYGQQPTPNTTETGLAHDPHPGAVRKQIDTQRYVKDIKEEIAKENGISASQIDLWSGMTLLEDHKRLYEYPNLQANPIEVRQKGDRPRPK